MRVLIVTGIFPPDSGGPATFVPHIAEALLTREHEVLVLTLADDSETSLNYPFPVIRIRRKTQCLIRVLKVLQQLVTVGRKVDLVFVNGLAFESAIAKFINRKPMVQKIVGDFAWERATQLGWTTDEFEQFQAVRGSWKVQLLKVLQRWWISKADKIIVPSHFLSSVVRRWGISSQKIAIVTNALVFGKCVESRQDFGAMRFITVGRLVKWKRVDLIIRAVAKIPDVELLIVGDGPEGERLRRLAQDLNVNSRIQFFGQMPHSKVQDLLARCNGFLLASTYEGLPHVALEALRIGLPVLATRAGGTPEVVVDGLNGRLVPIDDPESFVAALRVFVNDPAERSRLAEGAAQSSLKFNFHTMVSAVEAVLVSAASEHDKSNRLPMEGRF